MSAPKRIQRKRTKGWRMPEGAVYVGRPSKWGNPYTPDNFSIGHISNGGLGIESRPATIAECVEMYRRELTCTNAVCRGGGYFGPEHAWTIGLDVTELAGRDLACWCPLDQPCHADVLLEIANRAADLMTGEWEELR